MANTPRDERYSLLWRIGWNINYGLMHVYGPATLDEARDPLVAMRRDRDHRRAAHQKRLAEKAKRRDQAQQSQAPQSQAHRQEQH